MNFSKSKYCAFWQCPKLCWLKKNKPELCEVDPSAQARLEEGTKVGELAMPLFGEFIDVKKMNPDISAMIRNTQKVIAEGTENICEAAFDFHGLYCAVDILHKENGGYAIYEVKSSTKVNYIYLVDIAYQKYVLQKCGINVTGTYLVHINSNYLFDGNLDINRLFTIENVCELLTEEEAQIEEKLAQAEKVMKSAEEPYRKIGIHCQNPYECGYWKYCTEGMIPEKSVFDIYRLPFEKKIELFDAGIITYEDLSRYGKLDNPIRKRQVEYALQEKGVYLEKEKIQDFLKKLSYPLYFLDFETVQLVIPKFANSHPYDQIPFQFSLHYIEKEGGELRHTGYLDMTGSDPRRRIAELLVASIPENACVLAYFKAFECGRISELAELYPDLSEHLLNIRNHIVDLIEPFQKGYYYNAAMGGSFSIKSVLPAVYPDDPSLNYHNLENVHNGGEAAETYRKVTNGAAGAECEKLYQDLWEYCKLDTFAMVKLWQELVRVTKE